MKDYFVYILQCSDKSCYTGITSNLEKRLFEHNSGIIKGYTSKRIPVKLVYSNRFINVDDAISAEKQIKGWSRAKKEALIQNNFELLIELSKSKKKLRHTSTSSV
jgi:putative endonuclease